jgi:hypothetical protein
MVLRSRFVVLEFGTSMTKTGTKNGEVEQRTEKWNREARSGTSRSGTKNREPERRTENGTENKNQEPGTGTRNCQVFE